MDVYLCNCFKYDFIFLLDVSNGNMQPLYLLLLMLLYGFAFLPNIYALQFLFKGPATGYVVLVFFNMLTGRCKVYCFSYNTSAESYI